MDSMYYTNVWIVKKIHEDLFVMTKQDDITRFGR